MTRLTGLSRHSRPSGVSDLAGALDYVRNTSFVGARPGAERVVVPIVHMMPDDAAVQAAIVAAAGRLKKDCVTLLGLGVAASRVDSHFNLWQHAHGASGASDAVRQAVMQQAVTQPANLHYEELRDFTALESVAPSWNSRYCRN